jgi:multicomponent Na+:H+ antiporter subunit B
MILYFAEVVSLFVAVGAVALLRVRSLFTMVVLLSVYSGLLALTFAIMGAVDVAYMEAVVGTSVSTVFFMGLMWWIDPEKITRASPKWRLVSIVPALGLGGVILYGVNALPAFGDPSAPPMVHVSPVYAAGAIAEMATPNVVAAVLADYRSFDTMIEAAVVVTAVLACLLILKHRDDKAI